MATSKDHVSVYMPHYETTGVHFETPTADVSADIVDMQNFIRQKAEDKLQKCKSFTVSLPPSITGITNEENRIEFKSLFQTPMLNELEMICTNVDGSPLKLNEQQLRSVKATGEFEVDSVHFQGQKHRWKLNRLLQSGVQSANEKFFKECSRSLYMLMFYARDRIFADAFSFRASLRSWRQGLASLVDGLIGLPAMDSNSIDDQVESDRSEFLVIELSPNASEKEMHDLFCAQVPILLNMMEEHQRYRHRQNPPIPPKMHPYPHHFITPNNIHIDLRLYNSDLRKKLDPIVDSIINRSIPKNWFNNNKRRLINEYKHRGAEKTISKAQIAKDIGNQLKQEYTELIFAAIENSVELENLSPGLGRLLTRQGRSVLAIRAVIRNLEEQLDEHLKIIRETLIRKHPIRSKIPRWLDDRLDEQRMNFVRQHEWDAHQLSIERCRALGDQQTAYFIQRDMNFRKDSEPILRKNLKPDRCPRRTINARRYIWFPKNYVVERTYPEPLEIIPTEFANHRSSDHSPERRAPLVVPDREATYQLRRHKDYSTTTKYPFWRWKLFILRVFCWLSNSIYFFSLVVPFASPVSYRALFSPRPFFPDYELKTDDLKLHKRQSSKTQTFLSRLFALWQNVRKSRQKFEQAPDRGILGKNMQRIFNRLWNYIGKGVIGTIGVCLVYPITCLTVSTFSLLFGLLSPIWLPIGTLIFHILQILFYDASSAGEYGRKFFCMINTVLMDFGIGGIVQPILASAALVASPIVSALLVIYALLHRCSRGMYDTAMYHLIVRRLARVPAHDTFLARRIAGPGLAAEYFYQVSSPEVLAALESLIEQKELAMYRKYVESLLIKPINDYREFFDSAFRPFSAFVTNNDENSVFGQMNAAYNQHTADLRKAIDRRNSLLMLQRGSKHQRIRLTGADLTSVLVQGKKLVESLYPTRLFSYLSPDEIDTFWDSYDLENDDWLGLTSKLLQEIFCRDFLTPLEETDVYYNLKVEHLTLSKYARMINSAEIRDDLDAVTNVYLPETSYTIESPLLDADILNPSVQPFQQSYHDKSDSFFPLMSPIRYHKFHGFLYRFIYRKANFLKNQAKWAQYVDYDKITCRFSNPTGLPPVNYVNIVIFNRDHNSISSASIKNVPLTTINNLLEYYTRFHTEPMLPRPLPSSMKINEDLIPVDQITNDDEQ